MDEPLLEELRETLFLDEPPLDELRLTLLLDELLEEDTFDLDVDELPEGEKRLLAVPELLRTELLPDVERVLLTRLDDEVLPVRLRDVLVVLPLTLLLRDVDDVEPLLTLLREEDVEPVLTLLREEEDDDDVPVDVERVVDDLLRVDDVDVPLVDVLRCGVEVVWFIPREVPDMREEPEAVPTVPADEAR